MDSSDSSDEGAATAAAGRAKLYSAETLSKRRNSKEHLLKRSSAQTCSSRDGRAEPSNRSDDSPRPRSNSSGKDKYSAGVPHAGSKSPSPRHEKTEAAGASAPPPPLPPKGVRKAADANAEQCSKSEGAGGGYALPNKPQRSPAAAAVVTTTASTTSSSSFFKDELDFTSSRLESETNKMRFIEEIHRRQERERLHHQEQDRLARELTTTFKLTAGKRLTAKARELSKSQGNGIDDVPAAASAASEQVLDTHSNCHTRPTWPFLASPTKTHFLKHGLFQTRNKKSASRENIYDEVSSKAVAVGIGGQPGQQTRVPPHPAHGQAQTPTPPATAANPPINFSDPGCCRMEVMPAQRMLDPPDLFNTKSREKPLPRYHPVR